MTFVPQTCVVSANRCTELIRHTFTGKHLQNPSSYISIKKMYNTSHVKFDMTTSFSCHLSRWSSFSEKKTFIYAKCDYKTLYGYIIYSFYFFYIFISFYINKGHLAFFANIIQSQGCFFMNVDIHDFEIIDPLALPILWKIGHPYPINLIKKNFSQEYSWWRQWSSDCMANELGHVTYLDQSGHSK